MSENMNTMQHFVTIFFNAWDLHNDKRNLNPDWIQNRMKLMCKYTLPSLAKQTEQDFTTLIICAPESEESVLLAFNTFKTNLLPNVQFVFGNNNNSRKLRSGVSKVLDTRIDSDDMFRNDAIQLIRQHAKDVEVIVPPNGYIYDKINLHGIYWYSPPYYTFCVEPATWNDPIAYHQWWKHDHKITSHVDIRDNFKSAVINDPIYLMLIHNSNTLTTIDHGSNRKRVWWPPKKRNILKKFGIIE